MRVKICGIVRPEDGLLAAEAGADAIGLNFVGGPRRITPAQADAILKKLPPLVSPVALVSLLSGGPAEDLRSWLRHSPVRHVQVYDLSDPQAASAWAGEGYVVLTVVRVRSASLCEASELDVIRTSAGVILDGYDAGRLGGTGRSFSWEWVAQARGEGRLADWPPILLAGGLRPENVAQAVQLARPYGVDVSSGVEVEGQPGRKDPQKVAEFIRQARLAGQ